MKKIAFDIMGSDNGVVPAVGAALKLLKAKSDLHIVFVGDNKIIENELANKKYNENQVSIKHTSEHIEMTGGIMDIRRKKDSSMVRSIEMVRDGEADAITTGGSSAAFIAGCHFILGEMDGVTRPGFMPVIPTIIKNKTTLLLDVGANSENDPEDLVTFAKLASAYSKSVKLIEKPVVALLNIGEEKSKGKELQVETHKLLTEDKNINFSGNIEARELTSGNVDIIVTDGFTGNIALKAIEGMGKNLLTEIKTAITKGLFRKLAALRLKRAFKEVGAKFDYKNHAGAILIGVNGIAFKSHGSSDEKSFFATLRMTYDAISNDVLNKLKESI